ncbi:CD109 antigen isoform X3 [Homalodisca vitripennis]|uniref:CD109 antigen isoform X3 n=1 Tax=Homalodisca vitripennis TaxID=197043 RepID=UPI001EEA4F56|nr:CD109 antigen isoform X3 [Homalodisca vitripennis]
MCVLCCCRSSRWPSVLLLVGLCAVPCLPQNPPVEPETQQDRWPSRQGGGGGLPWDTNYGNWDNNIIIQEATYFIVASRMVRPGQIYKVACSVLKSKHQLTVRAAIQRNGVELGADSQLVKEGIPETLILRVPSTSVAGNYKLRVEGLYDSLFGGSAFVNETKLTFSQRSMTIFIQTDKPVYMQGQTVRFRAIPINTELKAFQGPVDVYMLDPNRHIMRRWLSRQSNVGSVSLDYHLSDQPVFGNWTIQVVAQNQHEEFSFLVEEYYQTRFEVNVTMPAFFFLTDRYLTGTVMANYTSGAPVQGNLTLKATIRPVKNGYRNVEAPREDVVRYFNFDESFPFWFPAPTYSSRTVPHLKYFYGVYNFHYPLSELEQYVPSLDGMEILVTATVGDRFLDEVIEGYSSARVFNNTIKLQFMGGTPQVFKPAMPFNCYISVSYQDGSPLEDKKLEFSRMEVTADVGMRTGGRRNIEPQVLKMSAEHDGVWELKVDLRSQLGLEENKRAIDMLKDIESMRITASFKDPTGDRSQTELLLLSHYSPNSHHIKVHTSTKNAKVGEYVILHVQSNFFMETFNYIVMSKGIILLAGQETMQNTIRTFAITLSAEMAPVATVLVYNIDRRSEVVADSLTFPVNGISRNNFTVFINNRKARTGEKVEVAIYGEAGVYVGLSGIDRSFYSMQAGNELTYARVLNRMARFDEETNGTFTQMWFSREGMADDIVYFPSSTYGIDANRTFEYSGLVVFSDIEVSHRMNLCNATQGFAECLNGRCYKATQKCDGKLDCEDGTDESNCPGFNHTELQIFRKFRFNHIQRQYENVWLWKDINIGPHGRYIFEMPVPERPAHWIVSAFSMSPQLGFGMLKKPLNYVGVLPFFINVEMPTVSHQGEQVGVRVTVFNYMTNDIEAVVVLAGSDSYKFVHVEMNGIVRSYNPRTSFGEHQFFIYIKAQDAAVVYVPIVPIRLGDIPVTIMASTLIGKDVVTRNLHVLADGLPQYRHQSILLDLSSRAYVFQYMHVNITETPIIPYDENRYYVFGSNKAYISIVGDVVGPIFPTMPVNSTTLIDLPMDCAEQTVFSFAANLYTTLYMRLTSQRNRTMEKQAFYHMNILYQRALSFLAPDGSFRLFRNDWNTSSSSVWLTSYLIRVFQEASFYEWENYIYIDPQVIGEAVWWVLQHQTQEGAFYEVTWLPDRKMNSSLNWSENYTDSDYHHIRFRNISLTAHVLIMLSEVKDLPGGLGSHVSLAQSRALHWLERNMKLLEDHGEPYEVAIVAYALMVNKASSAERAYGLLIKHARIEGGLMYWGKESVPLPPVKRENQKPFSLPRLPYKYDSNNIETTAYALLVYVSRQELMIDAIVKWLNAQRLTDGGWASTQDTAWAMKALIEYTNRARLRDVLSLTVTVEATALPGKTMTLHVDKSNIAHLQRIEIPQAWGTVKVQAKGAGYGILQMSVQYNVDIPMFQTQPPVKAFSLVTQAVFQGRNQSHISYHSCQRWTNLNESVRSGMAVLDITIPTGYIIQQQKLDAYILSQSVRNLQRARFQERKVLFYFDFLDETDTCVNFTIERWYPVANMSRYLPVRVYDYYVSKSMR